MTRKNVSLILKSKRADSRYFTIEESKETLSNTKKYDANAKKESRPIYTYKTGSTYEGEWNGGFRDGYGVQIWPDGARYEGYWDHSRA